MDSQMERSKLKDFCEVLIHGYLPVFFFFFFGTDAPNVMNIRKADNATRLYYLFVYVDLPFSPEDYQ